MKDTVKKGILAGMVLDSMSEDLVSFLKEQEEETKPSRINNKIFKKKGKKHRDHDEDDYYN
jgi:hypothetical protein